MPLLCYQAGNSIDNCSRRAGLGQHRGMAWLSNLQKSSLHVHILYGAASVHRSLQKPMTIENGQLAS